MQDSAFIQHYAEVAKQAGEKVKLRLADLSQAQLNWKPDPRTWSVAQCLEHLIISNSTYFPTFERIARDEFKMSAWERVSPFSRLFGKLLASQMQETVKMKMKTPPIFEPSQVQSDEHIYDRFFAHLDTFVAYLVSFKVIDLDKTVITSPAISFMTYPLRQVVLILVPHLHRHVNQAIRVTLSADFPT